MLNNILRRQETNEHRKKAHLEFLEPAVVLLSPERKVATCNYPITLLRGHRLDVIGASTLMSRVVGGKCEFSHLY